MDVYITTVSDNEALKVRYARIMHARMLLRERKFERLNIIITDPPSILSEWRTQSICIVLTIHLLQIKRACFA